MAIPTADAGDNWCVSVATGISSKPRAHRFTASRSSPTRWCGPWRPGRRPRHPRRRPGLRGGSEHRPGLVGRGGGAPRGLLTLFSARCPCRAGADGRTVCLLSAVKDGEITEAEAIKRLSRSPHWVWVAMDPVSKLILTVDVGERTLAMAQRLVHQVTQVLAPDCAPLFLTDGFREYLTALVTHYGQWIQPERRQAKGPRPSHAGCPCLGCSMRRWSSRYRRRRIVGVKHRVVFGPQQTIESILAKRGWKINTALSSASTWTFASMWRRSGGGSTRCANTKRGCVSSWRSSTPITISCCLTPAYACPCPSWQSRWNGQALAAADARDGGRADRSGVEFERGASVSCAPVAAALCGLQNWR